MLITIIILSIVLWFIVALFLLFMIGIGEGFDRAFGYGGGSNYSTPLALIWPIWLVSWLVLTAISLPYLAIKKAIKKKAIEKKAIKKNDRP